MSDLPPEPEQTITQQSVISLVDEKVTAIREKLRQIESLSYKPDKSLPMRNRAAQAEMLLDELVRLLESFR